MKSIVIGNIISFIGSIIFIYGNKQRDMKNLQKASLIAYVFSIVSLLILKAYTGIVSIIFNIFRSIIIIKDKYTKSVMILFLVIYWIFAFQRVTCYADSLCIYGASCNIIGLYIGKASEYHFRLLRIVAHCFWFSYYIYTLNISVGVFEVIYCISTIKIFLQLREQRKLSKSN